MRSRVVLMVTIAVLSQFAPAQAQDRFAAVGRLVAETRPALGSPGISVAVVVDDRLAWSSGYGLADVESNVPAKANTVYRIASISKTFAAICIMQLVEQGRVALDDPIQKYVPSFPPKGTAPITLRHILSHTSGIRHYSPGEMESVTTYRSIADAIKIFKDDPLLFTPGLKYSYSSYAYNLLAGVVETASGLSYEAYLDEHIFKPAGMKQSHLEHPQEIVPNRARQYVKADGEPPVFNAPYADLSIKWAGGGIISTVEDLARYHIAINQGKLLKPETLALMYTPATLTDGTKVNYGLGWMVQTDAQGRTFVAHSGGATGGTTFLWRYPAGKVAVAILCNVAGAPNLSKLAQQIATMCLEKP
jgi:serine beta-lactamase-like protein LACTB, mitochondrial